MKISKLSKKELRLRIVNLFNEYHRDIDKKIDSEFEKHTLDKIMSFLNEKSKYVDYETLESIFNCALFEKNYKLTFATFAERFKLLNTDKQKNNEAKSTKKDYTHASWANSEGNKRLVEESIKQGKVICDGDKKPCFTLDEYRQIDPQTYYKLKNLGKKTGFKFKSTR